MKRRGFLQAVFGAAAIPAAVKAAEAFDTLPPVKARERPVPMPTMRDYFGGCTIMCSIGAPVSTLEDLVFVMNPRPIVGVSEDGAFVIGD